MTNLESIGDPRPCGSTDTRAASEGRRIAIGARRLNLQNGFLEYLPRRIHTSHGKLLSWILVFDV